MSSENFNTQQDPTDQESEKKLKLKQKFFLLCVTAFFISCLVSAGFSANSSEKKVPQLSPQSQGNIYTNEIPARQNLVDPSGNPLDLTDVELQELEDLKQLAKE